VTNDQHGSNHPEASSGSPDELRDAVPRRQRLPDEDPSPEQIEIYRRMSPGRRLELAEQLYWSARRMKTAWLRAQHPDWTDGQIEAEVTRNFSHARS
jgi:hypothetical protein